ncbi:hypothetical protein P9112_013859 [Eukaryota sp. TZLM1-RC]
MYSPTSVHGRRKSTFFFPFSIIVTQIKMSLRLYCPFLERLYLDRRSYLLSARAVQMVQQYFDTINVRGTGSLDDVQVYAFLKESTNLKDREIDAVFDAFDLDGDGCIDFDEFYLMICILIAVYNGEQKQFLFRHSRTCFDLLDADGNGSISRTEFETLGFLFGYSEKAVKQIFLDFEIADDQELDFDDFRMFIIAAIDTEDEFEKKRLEMLKSKKQCVIL